LQETSETSGKILFISDANFLNEDEKGGVQICTHEYVDLFLKADFTITFQKLRPTRKILNRLLIRSRLDCFQHYDFAEIFNDSAQIIRKERITVVAINQINLAPLARLIKKEFGGQVKVILLSHGNETGDYLPFLVRSNPKGLSRILHTFRLGRHLLEEAWLYTHYIDLTLCISELEQDINSWLGARNILFIPRTFSPDFLEWEPVLGRIGFVGTLNHFPNIRGLEMVLEVFATLPGSSEREVRIVGGGESQGQELEQKYPFVKHLGRLTDQALKEEASAWSVFLNPVFWYSRGASTKLATGINWGLPILSTRQGNRGYSWKSGEMVTCANAQDMAEKMLNLSVNLEELCNLSSQIKEVAHSGESLNDLAINLKRVLSL
jgi:hypothetical protein